MRNVIVEELFRVAITQRSSRSSLCVSTQGWLVFAAMRTHRMFSLSISLGLGLVALAPMAHAQRATTRAGAGAAATATARPGANVLRMTYVPGQVARYTTRSTQTAPAPVGETRTTGHVEIETVAARPDGGAQLRMRITGMEVQGANVTDATRQQIARGVSGMAMTYTQDARGRISDRGAPTGVSAEFRPLIEGVLQSLDQMSPQLPEGAVSAGDHWSDHRTMHLSLGPSMALDMDIDVTYTLQSATPGQAASIGFQMTMGMGHGATMGNATVTGQGRATGEMAIDLAHGALNSSRSTGEMNMHVAAANGRQADMHTTFSNDMTRDGQPGAAAAAAPAPAAAAPAHH